MLYKERDIIRYENIDDIIHFYVTLVLNYFASNLFLIFIIVADFCPPYTNISEPYPPKQMLPPTHHYSNA